MASAKPSQPLAPTVWIAVALSRGSRAIKSNMRRTPTTSVAVARRVDHLALPHHIVDHDRRSWPGKAQRPFEIGRVVGLIRVDEDEIERPKPLGFDLGQRLQRCAGSDLDFVAKAGVGDVSARDIGMSRRSFRA